ncbi:hypothetical protein RJ641_018136 [Dillenia turbinata]|uniref:BHLH domain-containing protein n=1 Tax=Dillenia turbinata TaxID=194707 RepID=A0AAN8YYZ4_9MAGN
MVLPPPSDSNTSWIFFDEGLIDGGDLPPLDTAFNWDSSSSQCFNSSSALSVQYEDSLGNSNGLKENGSKKRFLELSSILDPGKPPKMDKAVVLTDAVRMVIQLRGEAQKLKEANENLQEKILELKAEKNDLREEKLQLKSEKENFEQQVKALTTQISFLPHPPIPASFAAPGPIGGSKLVPFIGFPGVSMWQFMPHAEVDTSQDHVLRPPVA